MSYVVRARGSTLRGCAVELLPLAEWPLVNPEHPLVKRNPMAKALRGRCWVRTADGRGGLLSVNHVRRVL